MISSSLLVLSTLLSTGISEPIYGGTSVGRIDTDSNKLKVLNPNEFPFMVNIAIQEIIQEDETKILKSYFSCGGTIIGSRTVLTAAHCITDSIYEPMLSIRAGLIHLKLELDLAQIIQVEHYLIHEKYVEDREITPTLGVFNINDIALLWTDRSFIFGPSVNAAILPIEESTTDFGLIVGWGETEFNEMSLMLLKAKMTVTTKFECQDSHPRVLITDQMICLISKNRDITACLGDSGGPFAQNGIIYGISSFISKKRFHSGKEKCDPKKTNIYTRVAEYETWIKKSVIKFSRTQNIAESLQFTNGIFRPLIDIGNSKLTTTNQPATTKKSGFWQKFKFQKRNLVSEMPSVIVIH